MSNIILKTEGKKKEIISLINILRTRRLQIIKEICGSMKDCKLDTKLYFEWKRKEVS